MEPDCLQGPASTGRSFFCSVRCLHSPLQGPVGTTIWLGARLAACTASLKGATTTGMQRGGSTGMNCSALSAALAGDQAAFGLDCLGTILGVRGAASTCSGLAAQGADSTGTILCVLSAACAVLNRAWNEAASADPSVLYSHLPTNSPDSAQVRVWCQVCHQAHACPARPVRGVPTAAGDM